MGHEIKLYQFETCPFCAKVRAKLDELGISDKVEKINMVRDREDPKRIELAEKSGVQTVPVIEIDGKFTGESDIIVEKLESMKEDLQNPKQN